MIIGAVVGYVLNKAFLYQSVVTLGVFFCLKLVKFFDGRSRRFRLFKYYGIPGPEPSILDGSMSLFSQRKEIFLTEEALAKKYGKVFGYFIGDEPAIEITDLDTLKKIYFEKNHAFTMRSKPTLETAFSHGLLFTSYERWKIMRRAISPAFKQYIVKDSSSTKFIEDCIKLMTDYIDQKLEVQQSTINVYDLVKSMTLYLISMMAIKLPDVRVQENEPNVKAFDEFIDGSDNALMKLAIMFPFVKPILQFLVDHFSFNTPLGRMENDLERVIDAGLMELSQKSSQAKTKQQQHLIDTLIQLNKEGRLTRKEVIGNALTVLFAGYDTTSTTVVYLLWVVSKYPEVQQKLRAELILYGSESKYLEQVIQEVMRLYPTVVSVTTRLATQTVEVNGLVIPQGTKVVYNNWLLNRDPEFWPEPDKFDPERFANGPPKNPCAYAPFGLGERSCLGMQLSMLEMKMFVCKILLRYKLTLHYPEKLEIVSCGVSLTKPKDSVQIKFERL